jgi:hypothetical protein
MYYRLNVVESRGYQRRELDTATHPLGVTETQARDSTLAPAETMSTTCGSERAGA